jgi:hypothetical protein
MESELLNNTKVLQNSYQLPSIQSIYYVIYMCGYMFRPPSGHPQAVRIHTMNITIETSVMGGQIEIAIFCVTKCMSI